MQIASFVGWSDYELLDSGDGYRLERFGKFILQRPDPQIIWKKKLPNSDWQKADAIFQRTTEDKGRWVRKNQNLPDKWLLKYKNLSFWTKLTPFKHTGIFPEQSTQWDFIKNVIANEVKQSSHKEIATSTSSPRNDNPNILNLFAYTGIATLAAASSGAKVTHVDASYPAIGWAKENQVASGLANKPIRWIEDDCIKFVGRELKRGVKYDGIIMDPPSFGHGPDGTVWKFNYNFPRLMELCVQVLSSDPLFFIVNAYAISSSSVMLKNVLEDYLGNLGGKIEYGELCLEEKQNKRLLSTGIFARWSK